MGSRVIITDDADDALFRIFDDCQGVQRRVFRIRARGFFNDHGIAELTHQLEGALKEANTLLRQAVVEREVGKSTDNQPS